MNYDRAFVILSDQLALVAADGNRMTMQKRNYIEALKVALAVIHEKIEQEMQGETT